jgi:Helix-hairpin-helix domain
MPNPRWDLIGGPIGGLRLPFQAWEALRKEGITTLDRLRAMADEIHTLPGIGPRTAQLIREELARVTSSRMAPD